MNLPEKFSQNMKNLLKDDYDKYILSLNKPKYSGIRINNLKITDENFFKLIGKTLNKVPWSTSGYYIDNKEEFSKSYYYDAGLFYIQEPSAMSVSSFLPVEEDDFILDLCASPGGKATAIADKLKGTGFLVANDISASRCKPLVKNIELMGITNYCVLSENHKKLEKTFPNFFDKIVLDVPCSGEGMFKSDNTALNSWNENTNLEFQEVQLEILESAKNMLKGNGIISYSTCTFSVLENECVIDEFLSNNPDFEVLPIDNKKYGFSSGLLETAKNESTNNCTRIFPHLVDGEGHFLCLLKRKNQNQDTNNFSNNQKVNKNKKLDEMVVIFQQFASENINKSFEGKFVNYEDSLFLVNTGFIDLNKVRTVRSGFYLGEVKNNKFKPSQNLASALKPNDFKNVICLEVDDVLLAKFLKGETIFYDCPDGYVLVCLSNFPIGFGISKDKKVKNKIGKSMIK